MLKINFIFYMCALVGFYSSALEYNCQEDSCKVQTKIDKKNWISQELSPNFGEKIAEDNTLYLQKMNLKDHQQNFERCYDKTQQFLLCYDDLRGAQGIEKFKQMGYEDGSRLYAASFYIFDLLYKQCGSIAQRFAIYQKSPHAFMGYIEFSGTSLSKSSSDIQIYLLPRFRDSGYGKKSLKLALEYMKQYLNVSSKDLSNSDLAGIANSIALSIPDVDNFFSKKGSKTYIPSITQKISDLCDVKEIRDMFPNSILEKFTAKIRKNNKRSLELFKSLGFCITSSSDTDDYYEVPC